MLTSKFNASDVTYWCYECHKPHCKPGKLKIYISHGVVILASEPDAMLRTTSAQIFKAKNQLVDETIVDDPKKDQKE